MITLTVHDKFNILHSLKAAYYTNYTSIVVFAAEVRFSGGSAPPTFASTFASTGMCVGFATLPGEKGGDNVMRKSNQCGPPSLIQNSCANTTIDV